MSGVVEEVIFWLHVGHHLNVHGVYRYLFDKAASDCESDDHSGLCALLGLLSMKSCVK